MIALDFQIPAARFGDDHSPFLSARLVADRLGVTLAELAKLIGVARNTLTAKSGARKVDSALSKVVRILAMASEMAGDEAAPHLFSTSYSRLGRQDGIRPGR